MAQSASDGKLVFFTFLLLVAGWHENTSAFMKSEGSTGCPSDFSLPFPQIVEEMMDVVQIIPQEFVQNRTVEQIVVEISAGAACFIEVRRDVHV